MSAFTAVVADIGGTNTRVALTDGAIVRRDTVRRYRNAEQDGIISVLSNYLADTSEPVQAAAVDLAGPVVGSVGTLTNLNWTVDADEIGTVTGAGTVAVLNDMQAQGHALTRIAPECLSEICSGTAQPGPDATRLVVNLGTGLNAALVYRAYGETVVPASESGHINLPVQDADDLRLFDFLSRDHGWAGAEEALAGRGIANLYNWLCDEEGLPASDLSPADVVSACAAGNDPRAKAALGLYAKLLGRYVGNLALIHLPLGGIYFCGGVSQHVAPFLTDMGFVEALHDKGRFSGFMRQFPVHLIQDDYAALAGTASHLAERMGAS